MMRRRGGQAGFTMIELTVSLFAGLIVALGIMGLSRDATHTFHEEMRSAGAEANLRTALDRLRADLGRAGFMSTGNVAQDPLIARQPGTPNPIPAAFGGLARLTSIMLQQGGSLGQALLSTAQTPQLNPDALEIGGNMTSSDEYAVSFLQPGGSGVCGGQRIVLDPQSPSMFRVLGLGGIQDLINMFQPTANGQFMGRILNRTGQTQFFALCPNNPVGLNAANQPFVDISQQTPIQLGVGGFNGLGTGWFVNPVQIVRWELLAAANEPAQLLNATPLSGQPLAPTAVDPTKYDLVRSYVDATTGAAIPGSTELIAEYAVDFSVAFSVDQGPAAFPPNPPQPQLATLQFDSPANLIPWGQSIAIGLPLPGKGPQRIRSVRVRLATRTAEPDRTLVVNVPNNPANQGFLYRYCVLPPCNKPDVLQYARVRTATVEVALPNVSRSFY